MIRDTLVKLLGEIGTVRKLIGDEETAASDKAIALGPHPDLGDAEAEHQRFLNMGRYLETARENVRATIQTIDYKVAQDQARIKEAQDKKAEDARIEAARVAATK